MQEEDKLVVAGKKVLVFGSGISGIGAVKLLEENGADVVLYDGNEKLTEADVRAKLQEGSKARIIIGAFPEELPNTLDLVILSPCTDRSSDYFKDERKRDSGYRRSGTCIYIW